MAGYLLSNNRTQKEIVTFYNNSLINSFTLSSWFSYKLSDKINLKHEVRINRLYIKFRSYMGTSNLCWHNVKELSKSMTRITALKRTEWRRSVSPCINVGSTLILLILSINFNAWLQLDTSTEVSYKIQPQHFSVQIFLDIKGRQILSWL